MCDSNRCATDVLPHDFSDIRGGVGERRRIVTLSDYADSSHKICSGGRCLKCGYDRGVYLSHTEVDGFTLECQFCENRLIEVQP